MLSRQRTNWVLGRMCSRAVFQKGFFRTRCHVSLWFKLKHAIHLVPRVIRKKSPQCETAFNDDESLAILAVEMRECLVPSAVIPLICFTALICLYQAILVRAIQNSAVILIFIGRECVRIQFTFLTAFEAKSPCFTEFILITQQAKHFGS